MMSQSSLLTVLILAQVLAPALIAQQAAQQDRFRESERILRRGPDQAASLLHPGDLSDWMDEIVVEAHDEFESGRAESRNFLSVNGERLRLRAVQSLTPVAQGPQIWLQLSVFECRLPFTHRKRGLLCARCFSFLRWV
jgi:hypothetical protein